MCPFWIVETGPRLVEARILLLEKETLPWLNENAANKSKNKTEYESKRASGRSLSNVAHGASEAHALPRQGGPDRGPMGPALPTQPTPISRIYEAQIKYKGCSKRIGSTLMDSL